MNSKDFYEFVGFLPSSPTLLRRKHVVWRQPRMSLNMYGASRVCRLSVVTFNLEYIEIGRVRLKNPGNFGFCGFSMSFGPFSNILSSPEFPRPLPSFVHNASTRRIHPRYPEVPNSILNFPMLSNF